MARKALDLLENRQLDPLTDKDETATQQVEEGAYNQIWITEPLKQAAKALQKSWGISQEEQMTGLGIDEVKLKFTDAEQRGAFLKGLGKLAKLINPNFPHTHPLTMPTKSKLPDPYVADGVWTVFWRKYFLPDVFSEVMNDVGGTQLYTLTSNRDTANQARAYLAAFSFPFIRMELATDEDMDEGVVEALTDSMREAQRLLVDFLNLLVAAMPAKDMHRVIIHGENQIEVNGKPTVFKGAALRALLALALLRDQTDFKVQTFAKHYHGGDVVEARHDFDNAMKPLKKMLPKLTWKASENNRTLSGVSFLVRESNATLTKRLKSLHKGPKL